MKTKRIKTDYKKQTTKKSNKIKIINTHIGSVIDACLMTLSFAKSFM